MTHLPHLADSSYRGMSPRDFALWGQDGVAYIKRVVIDDTTGWAICSADGTNLGMTQDRDSAFAAARQHDLEPVSVH